MKRSVMVILVLVLALSLAGPAPAATPKIKSQQCLDIATGWSTLTMAIKTAGKVSKATGPVKFFSINGEFQIHGFFNAPVVGTGHMNGTKFHFSVTGSGLWPGTSNTYIYSMEAEWDLAITAAQPLHFRLLRSNGDDVSFDQNFTVMTNCKGDSIAYLPAPAGDIDPATGLSK